jgi:murein DD-endopeptidase MepM/ murein hydrolase activator NlpD
VTLPRAGRAGARRRRALPRAAAAWLALVPLAGCAAPADRPASGAPASLDGLAGAAPPRPGPANSAPDDPLPLPDPGAPDGRVARPGAWLAPIEGIALPRDPALLPNARRGYRGGIHQGVDLYRREGGERIRCGEPVRSACDGTVERADRDWTPMGPDEYEAIIKQLQAGPDEDLLDRLRGRQVWVRAEDGSLLRYCHLDAVEPGLTAGAQVRRGDLLGTVGNTGTQDGASGTGLNCHLHFEIWTGPGEYLGRGDPPAAARAKYAERLGLP